VSAPNPYAPPREGPIPESALAPLPDDVRRYTLEPKALHEYLGKVSRAALVRSALIVIGLGGYMATKGPLGPGVLPILALPMAFSLTVGWLLLRGRVKRLEPRLLAEYELIVAPRVLRRTTYGVAPAEILAPEVASIVEVPDGLSIVTTNPKQRLFILRAVAHYAEVRDHVARWGSIESRAGLRGWLRKRAHRRGERIRDRVRGTLLANDEALREELAEVREIARGANLASIRALRLRRMFAFVAWLLILVVMAIWTFLPPAQSTP
jgi:hypothetical protein